jgi:hypothetical protein
MLVLTGSFAMAQGTSKMPFGIQAGVNFQNLSGKDASGNKLENEMMLGYHAGINIQIPIAPQFFFQPGLLYSGKGAKNTYTVTGTEYTNKTKLAYIELPLNLVYKALLGDGFFMLGFGPYVGYAFGGKIVTEGGSADVEQKIEFTNAVETTDDPTVPYCKPFDFGGNIFAGYEMANGIFFQFNTQLGMVNINPEYKTITDDKSSIKNTGFGLSLGYRL